MTPDYWSDAIAALSAADPVMARLIGAYPAEALVSRDDPFGTLARSIVGQQISVVAASSVWARLEREIGAVARLVGVPAGFEIGARRRRDGKIQSEGEGDGAHDSHFR